MVASEKSKVKRGGRAGQLAREDWLRAALTMVSNRGVSGLRVQELAASIGSTTGSLYWHFSGREDLVEAMLAYWAEATEAIAREVVGPPGRPEDRLLVLMKLVFDDVATASDLAIRQWAKSNRRAARTVTQVDDRRAQVVRGLFREMGFSKLEREMRTQLVLTYESCERVVVGRLSRAERARLLVARHRMLCRR